MKTLTKKMQADLTPLGALNLLKAGNKRFISNLKANRNLLQQADETSYGQYPCAVILSCMDSRTSPELIFDQGLGDVFSLRLAGNVINEDILGSMEFGCKKAGAKIIVVLGHSKCGAIGGAIKEACDHDHVEMEALAPSVQLQGAEEASDYVKLEQLTAQLQAAQDAYHNVEMETLTALLRKIHSISNGNLTIHLNPQPTVEMKNLSALLKKILPAIDGENTVYENRTSTNEEFVKKVTALNVRISVQTVMKNSPTVRNMIKHGECGIVGGIHNIKTGKVSFYRDTMCGFFKPQTEALDSSEPLPTLFNPKPDVSDSSEINSKLRV